VREWLDNHNTGRVDWAWKKNRMANWIPLSLHVISFCVFGPQDISTY